MLRHHYLSMPHSHRCVHYLRGVAIFSIVLHMASYHNYSVLCYLLLTDSAILGQSGLFWTFRELFPVHPMNTTVSVLPHRVNTYITCPLCNQSYLEGWRPLQLDPRIRSLGCHLISSHARYARDCNGLQPYYNCPCSGKWTQPLDISGNNPPSFNFLQESWRNCFGDWQCCPKILPKPLRGGVTVELVSKPGEVRPGRGKAAWPHGCAHGKWNI